MDNFDLEKMEKIGKFMAEDVQKLSLTDQLTLMLAYTEMLEKVQPIYEKYNKEPLAVVKKKGKKKPPLWEI